MAFHYIINTMFGFWFGLGGIIVLIFYFKGGQIYKILLAGAFIGFAGLLINFFEIITNLVGMPLFWREISHKTIIFSMPILLVCSIALWIKGNHDGKKVKEDRP